MLGARLAGEVQRVFQQRTVGLVDGLDVPGCLKVGLLGEVRSDEAIPGLFKLVEDSDYYVSESAAYALGAIGDKSAIEGLIKLVEHSDYHVRSLAAYALHAIGDKSATEELLKFVEGLDSCLSRMAADTLDVLVKIGDKSTIPGLLKLVEHSNSDVRWSAAGVLGNIAKQHKEKVVPNLPHLLTLIPSRSGEEIHRLILAIQAACKYYNYEIRQLSLTPESSKTNNSAGQTINIEKVGNLNTGTVNVKGDQIGTQHNNHPKN